ncbi:protein mesh-like [Ptychodera flava]|uniref:protein mesh-like n=1 Tax=Ptychodera flava TaxID=63121 RepID=UPI00396AA81E
MTEFEGALPGVNYDDVLNGVRNLTDTEIETLFMNASLPKHIEMARSLHLRFDQYNLSIQTALVDSVVGDSLGCSRHEDDTDCAIPKLINDQDVTWTQVCAKYLDNGEFRDGTQDVKTRLRNNCKAFYEYGQSLNASVSKYNPCSTIHEVLYPYGPEFGDAINELNDDGSSGQVFLSTLFPFFDEDHDFLWVNTNGVISFLKEVVAYTPLSFPLGDDWRLIAPFWADVDTGQGGNVFWREIHEPIHDDLNRATQHIRGYFTKEANFEALWTFVATWDHVTFFGSFQPSLANTFQAVLITNGRHSFAIFNYGDIVWTTGASSGGDLTTGLGGVPAQVGFNAGDGKVSYSVPGSQNSSVVDIEHTTNKNVPGRYAFRVDTDDVTEAEPCDSTGSLIVYPAIGSMLGGDEIQIGGPCFRSGEIYCKFGDVTSTGPVTSSLQALCVTPVFYEIGRIPIYVSVDDGATYGFQGVFTVVNIERTSPKVIRLNPDIWHSSDEVKITWDPALLKGATNVDINLLGYREDNGDGWTLIKEIVTDYDQTENGAYYTFAPEGEGTHFEVGAIRISRVDEEGDIFKHIAIWSDVHDLKWNFNFDAGQWCEYWNKSSSNHVDLTDDAAPCPCSLQQARADVGRYSPHPQCKIGSTCHHKPDAFHCVRVSMPSDSGAGRECCYNKKGALLYSEDSFGAGPSHRSHHDGVYPYKSVGKIPYLSHFNDDIRPWIRCCVYTNFDETHCREIYFARRPSNNCGNYSAPKPGIMFGDPHIITLDGHQYTFNGFGEFTMLDISNRTFTLQGRMAPLESNNIATVFNAFAMKSNSSDIIHVERNQRRMLDAYVRQEGEVEWLFIDFEENSWWNFQGVSVSRTNISDNKISILFENGISIEVSAIGQAMSLIFLAPTTYKNLTQGLMGTWNDDPSDDFMVPEGYHLSSNSTLEEIHNSFGIKWMITAEESLFRYRSITGESHSTLNNRNYEPIFEFTVDEPNITDTAIEICGVDNAQCLFDYKVTKDVTTAVGSREAVITYVTAVNDTETVKTCGYLPPPLNANKTGHSYTVGSTLTFDCLPGYIYRNGSTERQCQSDGFWDGTDIACDIVVCGNLETPRDGSMDLIDTVYKSAAYFVCDEGFDIVGSEVRRCQADGTWDGEQPSCQLVHCENITAPSNGTKLGNDYSYFSVVSFVCDVGFDLIGSSSIHCQANGSWNSSVPSCGVVSCGHLETPRNGSMNSTGEVYESKAFFNCDEGFDMIGSVVRTCQANGTWDGQQTTCKWSDCPRMESPMNGWFTENSNSTARTVRFACDEGFILMGRDTLTCFRGSWDDSAPICQVVTCPSFTAPSHGNITFSGNTYLSRATLSCDIGYDVKGQSVRICTASGTWSGLSSSCFIATCPPLVIPNNGTINSTGNTYLSVATFSCNDGYNLHGSSVRTCTADGSWDGQSVSCKVVTCPILVTPKEGTMTSTGNTYLSVATFSCNNGYNLHGSSVRTCTADGSWDGQSVSCEAHSQEDVGSEDSAHKKSFTVIGTSFAGATLVIIIAFVIYMVIRSLSKARSKSKSRTPLKSTKDRDGSTAVNNSSFPSVVPRWQPGRENPTSDDYVQAKNTYRIDYR